MLLQFIEVKKDYPMMFGNLCVIHYKEFTEDFNSEIYKIAAAVELLILSFDIFDDLQDNDSNHIWSTTPHLSMNSALALTFVVSKVISESSFEHKFLASEILDQYALDSINGQQLDLLNICQDEESYLNMISLKSGSLAALSCLLGVVLAHGEVDIRVKEYSNMIGVIQQIENDINDVLSLTSKNDFLNKKYSLPIIYLFEQKDEVSKLLEDYYQGDIPSIDISFIKKVLTKGGALQYAMAIKNLYKYRANEQLDHLSISVESKQYIKNLMK